MKAGLMIGRGGIAAMLLRVFLVVALVVLSCPADQAVLALCFAAVRIVELLKVMRASKISGGLRPGGCLHVRHLKLALQ
jgi:hypothetical protein